MSSSRLTPFATWVAIGTFIAGGCAGDAAQRYPAAGIVGRAYVDSSRHAWESNAPRPLLTLLWYPTEVTAPVETLSIGPPSAPLFLAGTAVPDAAIARRRDRYPLIVLSHGTGGSAVQLAWLGLHLARHGYIVAALNHHGNTGAEGRYDARGFLLWWERARDASAVIDRLLRDSAFADRIDAERIGAAGFSLGGYTVLELAGARTDLAEYAAFCASPERDFTCEPQAEMPTVDEEFARLRETDPAVQASLAAAGESYRDTRITSFAAIAMALGRALTRGSLEQVTAPVLIVRAEADRVAPPATNSDYVHAALRSSDLLSLPSVGHYTFLADCTEDGRRILPALCADPPGVNREEVHERVSKAVLAFFDSTLVKRR